MSKSDPTSKTDSGQLGLSYPVYEKGAWVLMRDSNGWIAELLDNRCSHKIRRVRLFSPLCPEGETGTCYGDEIERTITTAERDTQLEEFQRQPSMTPAASAADLAWWDGRWQCEGRGIHAGSPLQIRATDGPGEWLDVRIESTDGGRVLLAFCEVQGLMFSIRVGPGHEMRWP